MARALSSGFPYELDLDTLGVGSSSLRVEQEEVADGEEVAELAPALPGALLEEETLLPLLLWRRVVLRERNQSEEEDLSCPLTWLTELDLTMAPLPGGAGARPFLCAAGRRRDRALCPPPPPPPPPPPDTVAVTTMSGGGCIFLCGDGDGDGDGRWWWSFACWSAVSLVPAITLSSEVVLLSRWIGGGGGSDVDED